MPFGKGKQIAGHVAKQVIHTTPQSPNNLAYLLKSSHQEPKIVTKKVTVADGGTFDVIDFDAMRKAKTTPYTPTINDKIKKKSKKPSRRNDPISKASRKIKFENTMYNHELEKDTKTTETPMLDKLLGKPSRYVDTSAKIHNKKLQDKSIQIKDNITDSISDNIIDPVSKRTTKPIRKFVRKAQVSKQIKGYDLEKISKQYPSKIYDVTDAMKKPEINQNVFNDIVKKIDKKKKPLTKQQKAEPGQDWNVSNNEADAPAVSKQSTKSSTQIVETKPPKVKSKTKSPNKSKKKQQDDFTIVEQFLHQNRPKIKSTQTPMLDDLLGQKVGQRDTIKHDVMPKHDSPQKAQTTDVFLENLLRQNPKLDDMLGTKSKSKQKKILYDLLVTLPKQGTRSHQDYSFLFTPIQITTPKQDQIHRQRTRTKTKRLPASAKTPQIG